MRRPEGTLASDLAVAGTVAVVAATMLVAGVEGSPVHPALPEGAGPAGWLRSLSSGAGLQGLGPGAMGAVSITVSVLGTAVFLLALREAWREQLPERLVLWLGIGFIVATLLLPLMYSRDVYSYSMYGRMMSVHDVNPYVAVPGQYPADPVFPFVGPKWRETPAVYGPAFTLLAGGLTGVVSDLPGLIVTFKGLAAAGAIGLLLTTRTLARRLAPERATFATVLIGWNPVILFHVAGGAHNDVLTGLAVSGALLLLALAVTGPGGLAPTSPRALAATAVLTLGALVKVVAAVPLVLALVAAAWGGGGPRLRTMALHGAVVLGLTVAVAAPFFQWDDPTLGLATLATHTGWLAPTRLLRTLLGDAAAAIGGSGARVAVETVVRLAFALTFFAVFALLVRETARAAARGLSAAGHGVLWGRALLALILLGPVLVPWYAVWVLPVAWLLPTVPRTAVIVVTVASMLSQQVAETAGFPGLYGTVLLLGHYVLTPILLVTLIGQLIDLRRRLRSGRPLDAERAAPAAPVREPVPPGPEPRRREPATSV